MRVGVLMTGAPPGLGGGHTFEQEVFDRLLQLAPESPHRFLVVHPTRGNDSAPANVEFPLARAQPLHRVLRAAPRLWVDRTVNSLDVDVVWGVSPFHPVTDAPFITVVWDLQHRLQPYFPEVSAKGEWAARERQTQQRLMRAARIVVGTEAGKAEVMRFYQVPEERLRILPHPTPRFALEAAAGGGEAILRRVPPKYLLYPAQFWPHKNHANLLHAMKLLSDEGRALPLVLVGSDRGNAAFVRGLIDRLGLTSQVQILGFVETEELVALYRNAFALVYPSLFGPENLPPLEAFALGCPVIAARVSGAEEQLGDAAILVDALQPRALAAAISSLEDPALRASLSERGRLRARRFTGEDYVRGVFAILDDFAAYARTWRPET